MSLINVNVYVQNLVSELAQLVNITEAQLITLLVIIISIVAWKIWGLPIAGVILCVAITAKIASTVFIKFRNKKRSTNYSLLYEDLAPLYSEIQLIKNRKSKCFTGITHRSEYIEIEDGRKRIKDKFDLFVRKAEENLEGKDKIEFIHTLTFLGSNYEKGSVECLHIKIEQARKFFYKKFQEIK